MKNLNSAINKPTITIAIPSFNRLSLLKKTIRSVLAQEDKPDEIIVIDNASTDGTWEYLQTLKNITVFRNKNNIGGLENYNLTIKKARSAYVVSLASDDILLPNYVKIWRENVHKISREVVAFTNACYVIDIHDKVHGLVKPFAKDMIFYPKIAVKSFWKNHYFFLPLSCWTVFKKDTLLGTGLMSEKYGRMGDAEIALKILSNYPVHYNSIPACAYRFHAQQKIEYKSNDANPDNEYLDRINSAKMYYDFEKYKNMQQSFTLRERKERLFIRIPLMFMLISAIFYALLLQKKRALNYLKIFKKYYPQPYLPIVDIKIFTSWIYHLAYQVAHNIYIRLIMKKIYYGN